MAKFKLKGYSGAETVYDADQVLFNPVEGDVKVPFSYGEAIENVPISLDFSAGDQRVAVDEGYLVKSAVIQKPVDLVAENIKRGKVIAGIEGDFVGDTEEITVDGDNDLTFAGGDFVVEPSSAEKVISKVTISPPSELVPANIAKGVTIAGVEGTHEGGGGDIVAEKDVKFYDYDGTLLHEYTIAEANSLSELPALPTHDGLICQGWNYSLDKVKTLTSPTNIGAMYITDDGKTRVYIEYDSGKAAALTFSWKQTVANGVLIDWGDGSDIVSVSGTGSVKATHTYQSAGNFIATFSVVDGCQFTLGHGYNDTVFCGASAVEKAFVRSINIGGGSVALSNYAFQGTYQLTSITIPNGITSIGNNVFYNSSSLKSITIPSTVTSIGKLAFRDCASLETVSIPYGITSITEEAFNGCYSLTSICIPDSVINIEKSGFQNCCVLTSVHIPDGVTSIGDYAFTACSGLTSINIPDNVTSIGSQAFYGCCSLTNVHISEGVTSIGKYAFYNCYGLKSVNILGSVTSMGKYAFYGCYGLTSVYMSEGVTSIGSSAFYLCYGLSDINIPSTVTSIGDSAFVGCYGLTTFDFSHFTAIPTLGGTSAFYKSNWLTIKIPSALLSSWKAASNWSSYSSYMVGG